jgi:hypothetical protein
MDFHLQAEVLPGGGRVEWCGFIVLELAQGDFDIPFRLLEARAAQVFNIAVDLAKLARSSGSILSGSTLSGSILSGGLGGALFGFRNAARKVGHGGQCVVLWESSSVAG